MIEFLSYFCPLQVAQEFPGQIQAARGLGCLSARGEHPQLIQIFSGSLLGLYPAAEAGQRLPAGVTWTLFAVAGLAVAIYTAARAKSLAVGLAQRLDRQGQKYLLAQYIFKHKAVL
jgi:hypothetical protein